MKFNFLKENFKKNSILYYVLGAFVAIGVPINYIFFKDPPDNAFEEIQEEAIEALTGFDIDLSPDTPESFD